MKKLRLKKLNLSHKKILFKWYNLKTVLKNSLKGKKFTISEHDRWFSKQLVSQNIIKVIYVNETPIGVIRLEKNKSFYLLSYMVAPKYRRKGFAFKAIKQIISSFKVKKNKKIVAIVKKNNIPSVTIFNKLKFKQINVVKKDKLLKFEYKI